MVDVATIGARAADLAPRACADEQLLTLASKDPSALGPLYERYSRMVYARALAILGSREEAEDLTQDVFVSVFASSAYDPSRGSVGAFLIAMTRSRALD